ncbi:MAG: bifunctional phosphoribosylaminoimidazolecarboxamide formyltransferase/IMP cyclohydrolase PurH [Gemmatimonadales bacterium]|nr:MAG: bifunctional phosphoribosylaminoimidazolecarboxamide formyltransferase/IMP cyclohydrolase PurH [Gemmatimonadales bacterium]
MSITGPSTSPATSSAGSPVTPSAPRPRALLSVSDKAGIEDFGRALAERGFELVSTGGTARALEAAGLEVTRVSEVTGHPEIMDGRVKTLHPAIHGPLLARRDVAGDREALAEHGYALIDVVAVNLYPFRETVARGDVSVADAMEKVDIGGPTMIRAAAKNHANVLVVVDPADYPRVLEALDAGTRAGTHAEPTPELRRELAAKVFRHIASYDEAVARFLEETPSRSGTEADAGADAAAGDGTDDSASVDTRLPPRLAPTWTRQEVLRYGENPDQEAALYLPDGAPAGIAALEQLHGKALSYNNLLDLDGALLSLAPFALSPRAAVVIVKHTTPCGVAVGASVEAAFGKALATDPVSAFGSIIATNRTLDAAAAEAMGELFVECITAPAFTPEALEILTRKKNVRILRFPGDAAGQASGSPDAGRLVPGADAWKAFDGRPDLDPETRAAARFLAAHGRIPEPRVLRGIYGGVLAQTAPVPPFFGIDDVAWKVVTRRAPTDAEREDLAFAWAAVAGVKSNAILLAADGATLGIGAGQMSRVDSSRLAVWKAGEAGLALDGCALASDAFFPFRDGVDAAAEAGVRAIIQPGGSIRDEEVIAAADEHGVAMIFTGRRLFRH